MPLEAIGYLWMVWLVGWMLASLTAAKSGGGERRWAQHSARASGTCRKSADSIRR